jgi:hypothetical protein
MHNPTIAALAYFLAFGFILVVVAFHTPSKVLIAASSHVDSPIADLK